MPQKIDIYISCPVCQDEGYNSQRSYWYHSTCGGKLQLDEFAALSCNSCNHSNHISLWNFKCNNGRHDFMPASKEAFAFALSTSAQLVNGTGAKWLSEVLKHL